MQHLEDEVQRLSQMVLDMQARMTDMSSNLRLDFQEDASKMLVTLLSNIRQPVSATGAETQTVQVQDLPFGIMPMDEVMNKISQVADDLESKSNTLEDLMGRVSNHDGQIHMLTLAAENHPSTPLSASPGSVEDLRVYLDEKIAILREELMEGMDIKMADLKNSCDYKFLSVQEQCEEKETNYLSLAELMDSKESDLRNEIQELKSKLVGPGKGDLQASDSVLARVENLEIRLNSSEKTVAAQFLSVENTLKIECAGAIKDMRETVEDKLTSAEDRLTTLLVDTSNNIQRNGQPRSQGVLQRDFNALNSSVHTLENRFDVLDQLCSKQCKDNQPGRGDSLEDSLSDVQLHSQKLKNPDSSWSQIRTGAEQEAKDLLELTRTQHRELRNRLDELGREVRAEADHCRGQMDIAGRDIAQIDSRVLAVESLCGKLDPISTSLQGIKEGLNKQVTALLTCVNQLNGTVGAHAHDIGGQNGTCQHLQNLISNLARELLVLTDNHAGPKGKPEVLLYSLACCAASKIRFVSRYI